MDDKTVGIVPWAHDLVSEIFGRVTLHDFAGHREFYSGHITKSMTVQPDWLKYSHVRLNSNLITNTLLFNSYNISIVLAKPIKIS